MSESRIAETLKQLRRTLEDTRALGDEDREMLRALASDIQALLARPAGASEALHRSALARLEDAVVRFEVTHPELTAQLASVGKALGDMGI